MHGPGSMVISTMLCLQLCDALVSTCRGCLVVVNVRRIGLLHCHHGWPVAALTLQHNTRNPPAACEDRFTSSRFV